MPIYLVRWQDLSAALVRAADEDELVDTLDQLGDTEGARWTMYRGPLWLEFHVPAAFKLDETPTTAPPDLAAIEITDVSRLEPGELDASIPGTDCGSDMIEEIYARAFPDLHRVLYREPDEPDGPNEERLRDAARRELRVLVEAKWRIAGRDRSDDPLDKSAAQMRAPRRWVEQVLRKSGDLPATPPEGPPTPGRVKSLRRGSGRKTSRKPRR